ncbi:hypothetical protein PCE1_000198 [Barthelona sp. PCE]
MVEHDIFPTYTSVFDEDQANEMDFQSFKQVANNDASDDGLISFDELFVVPAAHDQSQMLKGSSYRSRRFMFRYLSQDSSSTIFYPRAFNMTGLLNVSSDMPMNYSFTKGAYFKLDSANLPNLWDYYFGWLHSPEEKSIRRSMAMYDGSIAIFSMYEKCAEGGITEKPAYITYESAATCDLFKNYIWGKYPRCFLGMNDYRDYIDKKPKDVLKSQLYYFNGTDLEDPFFLFDNLGRLRVKFLVLGDYMDDCLPCVMRHFEGHEALLKRFVEAGGSILAMGKSANIAQRLNIFETDNDVVDPTLSLVRPSGITAQITGCPEFTENITSTHEFIDRTLCSDKTMSGSNVYTRLVSSAYPADSLHEDNDWRVLSNHTSSIFQRNSEGFDDVVNGTKAAIAYRKQGAGYVINMFSNPMYDGWTYGYVFSAFAASIMDPLLVDSFVIGATEDGMIPGGEIVDLSAVLRFANLWSEDISDVSVTLWIPDGLELLAVPDGCINTTIPTPLNYTYTSSIQLNCSMSNVTPMEKSNITVELRVIDITFTSVPDITLSMYEVKYIDVLGRTNQRISFMRAVCVQPLYFRTVMNLEPPGFYPITNEMRFFTHHTEIQNSNDAIAHNVTFKSTVLLIAALGDGSNQYEVGRALEFDAEAYTKAVNNISDYTYPMTETFNHSKYIDFTMSKERHHKFAFDWDRSVRPRRVMKGGNLTGFEPLHEKPKVSNANYHGKVISDAFMVKETCFTDSDEFYELGHPSIEFFQDTWAVPESSLAKNDTYSHTDGRSKKKVLFMRNDVLFMKDQPVPLHLNASNVLTIERIKPELSQCSNRRPPDEGGYYSNEPRESDGFVGLEASTARNWALSLCDRDVIDLNEVDIEELTEGRVKRTYTIMPNVDPDVLHPLDMEGFEANGTHTLYGEDLVFMNAVSGKIGIWGNESRKGARISFALPGVNCSEFIDDVFISADHVAVFDVVCMNESHASFKFMRGWLPNQLGITHETKMTVYVLNVTSDVSTNYIVEDLLFDVDGSMIFDYMSTNTFEMDTLTVFRMAALEMELAWDSAPGAANDLMEFETADPVMFTMYPQELYHRPVHNFPEIHTNEKPLVSPSGAFSIAMAAGTAAVPMAEIAQTETGTKGLIIPAVKATSAVFARDVFGRLNGHPLRLAYVDVPPIPPAIRITTFAHSFHTKKLWNTRKDLDVEVYVVIKSNYPKLWLPTSCEDNTIIKKCPQIGACESGSIPYIWMETEEGNLTDIDTVYKWNSSYGACYSGDLDDYSHFTLGGRNLTQNELDAIAGAKLCADSEDEACMAYLKTIPNLNRRPSDATGSHWNFSPKVKAFHPEGYIDDDLENKMFDLIADPDYHDSNLLKGYPFDVSNPIPSHAVSPHDKPTSIFLLGMRKGVGYYPVYSKATAPKGGDFEYSDLKKFDGSNKRGWYSDNLQDRDDTILVGQQKSNRVSRGKAVLYDVNRWKYMHNVTSAANAERSYKNIYTCLFNNKILIPPKNKDKIYYRSHARTNYIVPLDPFMQEYDDRIDDFDCTLDRQYGPSNISTYNNFLETDETDYLYFGVHQRSGGLESLHIAYTMKTYQNIFFRSLATPIGFGYNTAWIVVNTLNSWSEMQSPSVPTIPAVRNDISLTAELLPSKVPTFGARMMALLHFEDLFSEFQITSQTYISSLGQARASVNVYVGGENDYVAWLYPDKGIEDRTTIMKLTIENLEGYDVVMNSNAMDMDEEIGSDNPADYQYKIVYKPTAYNFFNIEIPAELQPYITVKPYVTHSDTYKPVFRLMEYVNVFTIKSGYKALYKWNITVSSDLPDKYFGSTLVLPTSFNHEYFRREEGLPAIDWESPDVHLYIPFKDGRLKGKCYYVPVRSTDIFAKLRIGDVDTDIVGAKHATLDEIDGLRAVIGSENERDEMVEWFDDLTVTPTRNVSIEVLDDPNNTYRYLIVNLSSVFPTFPFRTDYGELTKASVAVLMKAEQLPNGWRTIVNRKWHHYTDFEDDEIIEDDRGATVLRTQAKGAWLSVSYSAVLGTYKNGVFVEKNNQRLKKKQKGSIKLDFSLRNVGDHYAYNVNATIVFDTSVSLRLDTLEGVNFTVSHDNDDLALTITLQSTLPPGSRIRREIGFDFIERDDDVTNEDEENLVEAGRRTFIKSVSASMDLTENSQEIVVDQRIETPFTLKTYVDATPPPPTEAGWSAGEVAALSAAVIIGCVLIIGVPLLLILRSRRAPVKSVSSININDQSEMFEVVQSPVLGRWDSFESSNRVAPAKRSIKKQPSSSSFDAADVSIPHKPRMKKQSSFLRPTKSSQARRPERNNNAKPKRVWRPSGPS